MRILFAADLRPDPNSGAGGSQYHTIQAIQALGHHVDALWSDDLPHRIRHWNLHYLLELPRALRNAVRERSLGVAYDVIDVYQPHAYLAAVDHVQSKRPGIFVNRNADIETRFDRVVRAWQRRLGVRYRTPMRAIPGYLVDLGFLRAQRRVARYAHGHVVMSSENRDWLVQRYGVPVGRIAAIAQAPPAEYLSVPLPPFDSRRLKHLLAVGQVTFYKGIQALTAAVNRLLAGDPAATFTWVCPHGQHEQARAMLDPQVHARCRQLSGLSNQEMIRVADACGVFLFPSITEGFGKAFLEAMARGLCVVTTQTAGMRDVIRHDENGFFVGVNDPDAIVRTVRQLWQEPERAETVSAAAVAAARQYSWERVGRETLEFYEHLQRECP